MIAYLRDELQETKAKTRMERCYTRKSTDLQVHQTQKKCSNAENVLAMEIQVSPSPRSLLEGLSS